MLSNGRGLESIAPVFDIINYSVQSRSLSFSPGVLRRVVPGGLNMQSMV